MQVIKRRNCLLVYLCICLLSVCRVDAESGGFEQFVTREGHQLQVGGENFRFAGIHAPELHRIEDDARGLCAADPRDWGQYFIWPTPSEQENWIKALVRSGHRAMRIYVLSVESPYDVACGRETHILKPSTPKGMPRLNEAAMVHYDRMIALADQHGLRLILPFIDHWHWWGGRKQLAAFYGEGEDDFYRTSSRSFAAYLHIIEQVITRKNSLTGRYYYEEKAIMAWETGNELKGTTPAFLAQAARHIKRLAPKQLVVDGTYLRINDFALNNPDIDIVSNHFYDNVDNNNPDQITQDLTKVAGKKVYIVGEFGLKKATELSAIMQSAVHTSIDGAQASGAFIWGFRGHRRGGGFYWHREYTGHYSYHLPGFPEGEANEEQAVVNIVRLAQAQMRGLTKRVPLPVPEAPTLLPISDPAKINWLGAPLGRFYRVERRQRGQQGWQVIGEGISDGENRFDPDTNVLFSDSSRRKKGQRYEYRVIARNESGESTASNVETYLETVTAKGEH